MGECQWKIEAGVLYVSESAINPDSDKAMTAIAFPPFVYKRNMGTDDHIGIHFVRHDEHWWRYDDSEYGNEDVIRRLMKQGVIEINI